MAITVRPATEDDLPQIHAIFAYYVRTTVISFLILPPPIAYVESRYRASRERQLPYLVAVDSTLNRDNEVVGYTYASPFRGFMLGYGHTVEMTIFCHHAHTNRGIGSLLLDQLLVHLRETKHLSKESGHEDEAREFEIRTVLAVTAVDDRNPRGGLALRDWYVKRGFHQAGRMSQVGFKQGRV